MMCELRCKRRKECISYAFEEMHLSCRLRVNLCNINKPKPMPSKQGNIHKSDVDTSSKETPVWKSAAVKDFFKYVQQGDLAGMRALLFMDLVNVNCSSEDGLTAVMIAAKYKREKIFYFLFKKGCDLTAVDIYRRTVLHYACYGGNMYIVKTLLNKKITNINCRQKYGETPLKYAVKYNHRRIVDLLIDRGADYKVLDEENNNILHVASAKGNVMIVNDVLSRKLVDIESRGYDQRTPLMMAAWQGHKTVFDYLKDFGADCLKKDAWNNTILHLLCIHGHKTMVNNTLSLKLIDIDSRGYKGRTPLMTAAKYDQETIVKLLVEKGADIKAVDNYNYNLLHVACVYSPANITKYVLSLNVLDTESRDNVGATPLMCAVKFYHASNVGLLVEAGADINAVDDMNYNIFHIACRYKHLDRVEHVLSLNFSYLESRGNLGRTPLMIAIMYNDITVVQYLVKQKANTTKSDDLGYNVIHFAAKSGKLNVVKYLLTLSELRGFETRQDKNEITPAQVAEMKGYCDIVSFLKAF